MSMSVNIDSHCFDEKTEINVFGCSRGMIGIHMETKIPKEYALDDTMSCTLHFYKNAVEKLIPLLQKEVNIINKEEIFPTFEGNDLWEKLIETLIGKMNWKTC